MIEEKRRARINGNVNSKNHCKRVSLSQFIEKQCREFYLLTASEIRLW